ncbi:DEAD/DEAH box helicase family protein [Streptomyces sp. XM4193]|uniref:DEAD/DEAH box helicase family protein n=1 Tax=Streptomyces sp. XM4193 TaxID=2929782 RepID=UPI001FF998A3|nr:DEAD/DEAH box helicase family protein [Streptomyces sp. XM4193]MCK1796466.1 DEAD/DEAH box helicase family protein [Streptomyces sp. XM4193]
MSAAGDAAVETFARTRPPVALRRHQQEALDRLTEVFAGGQRRAWLVLPPGLGKTLTGLEAARRLGRRTVVLGPNTAIQGQWVAEWDRFRPQPEPAGTDRDLAAPLTVLTYQALASFDPEAEIDEEGATAGSHLHRLRPQGRALVAALRGAGEVTLLLDECHHLLDTWGELLAELLRELPRAHVVGLTATPPERMTAAQAALVGELFGPAVRGPSIPAAVREGQLAPYAELAWLTTPTGQESDWLSEEAERFTRLTTRLLEPSFAPVPFLHWLDERIVRRSRTHAGPSEQEGPAVPWHRFAADHPELADAALRFHHHGLLALPEGARLLEAHRHPPGAADWVRLLDDWVRGCLRRGGTAEDLRAEEEIRSALPSIGYQLTKQGVRAGRSPLDRVVARSAAKTAAVREILAAELASLGSRLRAVVVCDHERARATLPSGLAGVLDAQAGSARLVLTELIADPRTAALCPLLVTGSTVAADPTTADRFVDFCKSARPSLRLETGTEEELPGAVVIGGAWTSRRWVALATRFFEQGGSRALIGTRGLLGEGWNAEGVNTLVDLTEATTPTAVVQTRGRALRLDPAWPTKTAATWSVVCVAPGHPRGTTDWDRFVRKHEGYLGVTDSGAVMSGVAHVHPDLSPYAPPPHHEFDARNAAMLRRSEQRDRVRELWRIGTPYEDRLGHAVRITPGPGSRSVPAPAPPPTGTLRARPPVAVPAARGTVPAEGEVAPGPALVSGAGGAVLAAGAALLAGLAPPLLPLLAAPAGWAAHRAAHAHRRARARAQLLRAAAREPVVSALAWALADGLRDAGLLPVGAEAVTAQPDENGTYQVQLEGVGLEESELFATAFDEVIAPLTSPRYLLPRYVVDRHDLAAGRQLPPHAVVHHAVPTVLGRRRRSVDALAGAWRSRVSAGDPIYTQSPEGAGLLAAQRGRSPLDVTTALRVNWS